MHRSTMVSLLHRAGRTFVAAGTIDGVVANGFRSGNTTMAARCDYVIILGLKRTTTSIRGGSSVGIGRGTYHTTLHESPSELPKKNCSSNTSTKLARAKLDKCSGDAGMSKDMLGPGQPGELRRSWYVEGHLGYEGESSREAKLT
ncbi:hypothetical protein Tco_1233279 [Tanacetum coccineum]